MSKWREHVHLDASRAFFAQNRIVNQNIGEPIGDEKME